MNSVPRFQRSDLEPDWALLRSRFPVLGKKTYLNSCAYGAMATDVMEALDRYCTDRLEKGTDWQYWVEQSDAVRDGVARLLGATANEIAVTASASAGINAIASSLDFTAGRNKIVISDYEFPTSGQIWYAQEARGAEIVRVAEQDGTISPDAFESVVDEETRIVAVTQVCYRNGARLDIPAIAEIAHRHGALLLVDGYQGLGTVEFDVNTAGADLVVGGMLKYLLGTAGIGFLYVRESLIADLVPTFTGWFAQADIFAMDHTRNDPAPTARRFEMGTPPVPNCYAAREPGSTSSIRLDWLPSKGRLRELTGADRRPGAGRRLPAGLSD